MGTTSIEEFRDEAPLARHWFQLYLWRDRDASGELVERARKAGYDTLVLTVDTPVPGARLRDNRNGLTIPPSLTARTLARHGPAPGLVGEPADHRAADVRVAELVERHGRRPRHAHVRPHRGREGRRAGCASSGPGT